MADYQLLNRDKGGVMSETKYLETHEWYIVDGEKFTVGISDYAQGELGDIVFVTLPEVGQEFSKGDAIVEVEATKTVAEALKQINNQEITPEPNSSFP